MPSLERIYNKPTSFFGQRFKHVIEPRATFRYVTGVNNFNDVIRFDEVDLWSNTNELELSLANRFYGKAKNGEVKEVLSWEVRQKRFFDPTFGGAVVAGRRNEVSTALDETAFAFLDQPRGYSPIISELRSNPFGRIGVEWRTDYDPMRGTLVNNSISGDAHFDRWNVNLGYTMIKCVPVRLVGNNQDPCTMQTPPGDSVLSPPVQPVPGPSGDGRREPARVECRLRGVLRFPHRRDAVRQLPDYLQHRLLRVQFPVPAVRIRNPQRKPVPLFAGHR